VDTNNQTRLTGFPEKTFEEQLRMARYLLLLNIEESFARHNLNNYLGLLRHSIEGLRRDLEHNKSPELIRQRFDWIEDVFNKLFTPSIGNPLSEDAFDVIDINTFVFEQIDQLTNRLDIFGVHCSAELNAPGLSAVRTNKLWLIKCLDMLIDNAVRAMQDRPQKILVLATAEIADNVEIHVKDNGNGVPAEIRERLFREPIQHPTDKHPGIGLLLASQVIQSFGGSIRLMHSSAEGSVFGVSLPKA
jgi:signal transduction histidine kinase